MTKIDIFSGFLGAGKTTLIKKLIKEAYAGEKVVLIENEFGEIGIDGGFLEEAGINITEDELKITPAVPEEVGCLNILGLYYKGQCYDLKIKDGKYELTKNEE